MESQYDIIIIGGGIHGAAIAADASGRGLKVLLCEQSDLASATSSASSKLIHGGLRYLEHFDFALVKESLRERDKLFKMAPYLVRPLRFIVPIDNNKRPIWLLRLGLYLYDLMGYSRYFKRSKFFYFNPERHPNPLQAIYKKALIYSDAATDDARLVVVTAQRAAEFGATILTRTQCLEVNEQIEGWQIIVENQQDKKRRLLSAKVLINATGPWIDSVLKNIIKQKSQYQLRLIKGSHIVVPAITAEETAYLLQNDDDRVIFVVPYHHQYTMIGTTDVSFTGSLDSIHIDNNEINYLCNIVSHYFQKPLTSHSVISSWSGVRSLVDDKSPRPFSNSREYKIELAYSSHHRLPYINIFGGKLTTHRILAEKTVNLLKTTFPHMGPAWTSRKALPGGNIPQRSLSLFLEEIAEKYPWITSSLALRYAQNYGTMLYTMLEHVACMDDLGRHFGHGLYEKEVDYLMKHEWALTADDILWRRTKLGLLFSKDEVEKLELFLFS